ncbi:MAG: hypothetical protein JNL08_19090 [Planctomycetes bacterium]|nr:hypothetical protein [Planctomycetota bacterium]
MKTAPLLAVLSFAPLLLAQDPPTPPGGFTFAVQTVPITFSDGVMTGMDIYTPNAVAGPTGWPGVLVMHGGDGTKNDANVVGAASRLAEAGYVCYAFSDPERPGQTQERELLDTAESHGLAQAAVVGTTIDPARLAVTGFSGGGRKSYQAAAWSGRPLPLAGFVTDYPLVLAVVPQIAPLDNTEGSVPDSTMVADHNVIDKPAGHPWLTLVDNNDFVGLRAAIDTPFNQSLLANLATTTVPVLSMFAMQDFKIVNNPSVDAALTRPLGPNRLFLSTGSGHSTVNNTMETAVMHDLRRRWFDRFLKGIANGVDLEPLAEVAMQPTSTALHLDPATIWEHRTSTQWPPAIANARWHCVGTQALQPLPPNAQNFTNVIQHVVPAAYDVFDYVAQGAGLAPNAVTANIAPSQEVFTSQPLTEAIEILGRPQVRLTVDDTTGNFQLTAVLAHQDPAGGSHWITAGTEGTRTGIAGTHIVTIDLGDVAQVVPAGNRLVLRIQNLADINGPNSRRIRMVPYFDSTQTTLLVGPGIDNWVDVPSRPYQAALLPRLATVSATAGIAHPLQLRGGATRAGQDYLLALGVTGEAPGFLLDGVQVPMNFDAFTGLGLTLVNTPILPNSAGVLDAAGNANSGFHLPPAIAVILQGLRFTFTGIVFDAGGLCEVVGGAATMVIDP